MLESLIVDWFERHEYESIDWTDFSTESNLT